MNIYIGGDLDGRVIVLDKPCFNAKKVNKTKAANYIKLTKITKHAKRHFWLNDVCTCHGLLPSHSA